MRPITVRPTYADLSVANAISAHTGPRIERAAKFLTWGADEHILCALAAGWWLYCRGKDAKVRRASDHIFLTTLVSSGLPHILKMVFDQERPDRRTVQGALAGCPVLRQAARRISIRPCRAHRGVGFRGQYASREATQCDLEHRRRVGPDAGCTVGALGERCCCRPCRGRCYGTDTQVGDGLRS